MRTANFATTIQWMMPVVIALVFILLASFARRRRRRLFERRGIRSVGNGLQHGIDDLRLQGTAVLPVHWNRVDAAYGMGHPASLIWESAAAVRPYIITRLRDLRSRHRALVFCGGT
jgi:hypothetical protein